jgi:hypothetical protein
LQLDRRRCPYVREFFEKFGKGASIVLILGLLDACHSGGVPRLFGATALSFTLGQTDLQLTGLKVRLLRQLPGALNTLLGIGKTSSSCVAEFDSALAAFGRPDVATVLSS